MKKTLLWLGGFAVVLLGWYWYTMLGIQSGDSKPIQKTLNVVLDVNGLPCFYVDLNNPEQFVINDVDVRKGAEQKWHITVPNAVSAAKIANKDNCLPYGSSIAGVAPTINKPIEFNVQYNAVFYIAPVKPNERPTDFNLNFIVEKDSTSLLKIKTY
jgi:hypothetical protein